MQSVAGARSAHARTDAPPAAQRRPPGNRRAVLALVAVAVLFAVAQLVLFPLGRGINWDEAVYLSQVMPGEPAADFASHRARGLVLLLAPAGLLGASLPVVRVWVIALSSVGLVLAFRPWTRTIGAAAPVAALLFAGWWTTLVFGSEMYPNSFAALGVIAAVGSFAAYVRDQRRGDLVIVAAAVAFAALVRPLDGALAAIGIFVAMLVLQRRSFVPVTVALAVGGLLGFAPWMVEGWVMFGYGPIERLFAAQESGASGVRSNNVLLYLNNLAGPYRCNHPCKLRFNADPTLSVSRREAAMVVGFAGLAAVALLTRVRSVAWRAAAGAALAAGPMAAYYATCRCAVNLRYVLPVYGLVCVLAAVGLVAMWTWRPAWLAWALRAGIAVSLVAFLGWQSTLARDAMRPPNMLNRERARALAQVLDERAGDQPCIVATESFYPLIQYWSKCLAVPLRFRRFSLQDPVGSRHTHHDLAGLRDRGYRVFALAQSEPPPDSPLHRWEPTELQRRPVARFTLYEPPADLELEPAARP